MVDSRNTRLLYIYDELIRGKTLTKQGLIDATGAQGRAIQRDIQEIRAFLADRRADVSLPQTATGRYRIEDRQPQGDLTDPERLAIGKVMLASRSLANQEMTVLLAHLVSGADQPKVMARHLNDAGYIGAPSQPQLAFIAAIAEGIRQRKRLAFDFTRGGEVHHYERVPRALFFSDLYFFMLTSHAGAHDEAALDEAMQKFELARITNPRWLGHDNSGQHIPDESAAVIKQSTLSFLGAKIDLEIEFYADPRYVTDRFPGTRVLEDVPIPYVPGGPPAVGKRMIVPTVDSYGTRMWLLQQAHMVKVLRPLAIRQYVTERMRMALANYEEK
ncbi:helix-turn-helix transcriptional regulator [Lacticaseibacillus kribbianus]|uniref:helix-turn-helix transcriptional regulator n=1 Tax=Lacticaseibacillus kribbianus TaxID=2926292 RepID=UPI001CD7848B|nr:WYL domain-containing protein [Lacticaseibacillus kribbianus]